MSGFRKHDSNMHKQSLSVYYTFPRPIIHYADNPIQISYVSQCAPPKLSCSMYNYLSELKIKAQKLDDNWVYYNSYMWLYMPTTIKNICVSGIEHVKDNQTFIHNNIILYELIEISCVLHLFTESNTIICRHFGNHESIYEKSIHQIRNTHGKQCQFIKDTNIMYDTIFIDATNDIDNEYEISKLAITYICQAILMQKRKGTLVLKMGDCFSQLSLDTIFLLSSLFEKSYFMKPTVSFLTSSTRYFICRDFRFDKLQNGLRTGLQTLYAQINQTIEPRYLFRILKINIPSMFTNKLEEINSILGQPRLEYIHQCLNQHELYPEKPLHTIPNDIRKCVDWCMRFKVPIQNVYNICTSSKT